MRFAELAYVCPLFSLSVLEGLMFWADSNLGRIERARLDGSERTALLHEIGARYFGLSLSQNYLFITDWSKR